MTNDVVLVLKVVQEEPLLHHIVAIFLLADIEFLSNIESRVAFLIIYLLILLLLPFYLFLAHGTFKSQLGLADIIV